MEWIKRQEPLIVWDDSGHEPLLRRESDYDTNSLIHVNDVRDPAWQRRTGGFTAVPQKANGEIPLLNVSFLRRFS
jgi:hypothetical protein